MSLALRSIKGASNWVAKNSVILWVCPLGRDEADKKIILEWLKPLVYASKRLGIALHLPALRIELIYNQ